MEELILLKYQVGQPITDRRGLKVATSTGSLPFVPTRKPAGYVINDSARWESHHEVYEAHVVGFKREILAFHGHSLINILIFTHLLYITP